jgi:hypothetical protein
LQIITVTTKTPLCNVALAVIVVRTVALGHVFLPLLLFPLSVTFHRHSVLMCRWHCVFLVVDSIVKQHTQSASLSTIRVPNSLNAVDVSHQMSSSGASHYGKVMIFLMNQWRILIRRAGLAERYNAALCILPLYLTCESGFATGMLYLCISTMWPRHVGSMEVKLHTF